MTAKAVPHPQTGQPFRGTPTGLPRVLLCAATERWCGRHWTANTVTQHEEHAKARDVHEQLCANRAQLTRP